MLRHLRSPYVDYEDIESPVAVRVIPLCASMEIIRGVLMFISLAQRNEPKRHPPLTKPIPYMGQA